MNYQPPAGNDFGKRCDSKSYAEQLKAHYLVVFSCSEQFKSFLVWGLVCPQHSPIDEQHCGNVGGVAPCVTEHVNDFSVIALPGSLFNDALLEDLEPPSESTSEFAAHFSVNAALLVKEWP